MMRLEQTDPELRKKLLAKAIGDQQLDEPVNVTDIANADPVINGTSTKQLDIQLNAARKNIDDAIKFSKRDTALIVKEGGTVNKQHLQKAS